MAVPAPYLTITRVTVSASIANDVLCPVNCSLSVCTVPLVAGMFWIDSTPSRPSLSAGNDSPLAKVMRMEASPAKQLDPPRSEAEAEAPGASATTEVPLDVRQYSATTVIVPFPVVEPVGSVADAVEVGTIAVAVRVLVAAGTVAVRVGVLDEAG